MADVFKKNTCVSFCGLCGMERGEIGKGKVFLIANKKVGEIEN